MNKSTGILLGIAGFFFGVVVGFLVSPVKKGIRIGRFSFGFGCNNGNSCAEREQDGKVFDEE